jgi:hypothetical protein
LWAAADVLAGLVLALPLLRGRNAQLATLLIEVVTLADVKRQTLGPAFGNVET